MRVFNELSALWRAPAFSRLFFQDVALRWKGLGLRYLFLVLFLTWFVILLRAAFSMTSYIDHQAPADLKDFPTFTIKAGHAASKVKQPFIMKDAAGQPFFVLDTTGKTKLPQDVGANILVTESDLIMEDGRHNPLSGFPDTTVDTAFVLHLLRSFRNMVVPVGLPLMVALLFVYRLILGLIFAGIGRAFAAAFKAHLPFKALFRLAIIAMTADLLLSAVCWLLPFSTCFGWIAGHVLTLVYLAYAIKVSAPLTTAPSQISDLPHHFPPAPSANLDDPFFP